MAKEATSAVEQEQAQPDKLLITKERVKDWNACSTGYRWFLEKFPQGGAFAEVHAALNADKRYADAGWLLDHVFAELDTSARVVQTCKISGADEELIRKLAAEEGGPDAAATTGYRANAATTGNWANAATTGNWANAATTGNWANAATTGYRANAATTGEGANAATTGNWANAATTGNWANAATTGEGAIAASLGIDAKAKAGPGGAIVLAHRNNEGALLGVKCAMVGQDGIKPDVWYSLDAAGNFVEAE
jgi:hypothetical protein